MIGTDAAPAAQESGYWRDRVFAETRAALACKDARSAALHVELATRCLRMAQQAHPQIGCVPESAAAQGAAGVAPR